MTALLTPWTTPRVGRDAAGAAQPVPAVDALGRRLSPGSLEKITSRQRAFAGTDATYAR